MSNVCRQQKYAIFLSLLPCPTLSSPLCLEYMLREKRKNTSFPLVKQKVFVKQTSGRFMSQENTFKFNSFLFFLVFTFLFICQLRSQFSPLFPHTQRTTRMTGGLFCVKRLEMFVMFIYLSLLRQTDCEYFKRQ